MQKFSFHTPVDKGLQFKPSVELNDSVTSNVKLVLFDV